MHWACILLSVAELGDLDSARKLLADFRPADALVHLERAREGALRPRAYVDCEMLGIAYAYRNDPPRQCARSRR